MRQLAIVLLVVAAACVVVVRADHNCEARYNYCANDGVCHDITTTTPSWTAPSCACNGPFAGNQCEINVKECVNSPCGNGATCTTSFGGASCAGGGDCYTCSCKAGYTGQQCIEPNACWSNPCQNGATCSSDSRTPTVYHCQCPAANVTGVYAGYNCETFYPTADCTLPGQTCQNGGTCTSGQCTCALGFAGAQCQRSSFCSSNPCQNGATCNTGVSVCQCTAPYARPLCATLKFCASNPCQNQGTCTDSGNFGDGFCTCSGAYWGLFCEKTWNQEGCFQKGCSNGGFSSLCQGGCGTGNAVDCADNSWATTCDCNAGWGDCQCNSTTIDNCPSVSPCQHGGTCFSYQGGWKCACQTGFYGDRCESYDNLCVSANKCQNNGVCSMTRVWSGARFQVGRGYDYVQCNCPYPYYGEFCESKADVETLCYTAAGPCNGGNCTLRTHSSGYWSVDATKNNQRKQLTPHACHCASGLYGDSCELTTAVVTPTCATLLVATPNWCQNQGTCVDDANGPVCKCPCGYRGDNCEVIATDATRLTTGKLLDYCGSGEVCYNGGTCFNAMNGQDFFCNCMAGFWGTRCQNAGKSAGMMALPSLLVTLVAIVAALKFKF